MENKMAKERLCSAIQDVMAESMMLGIKVFRSGVPSGSIYDSENSEIYHQFNKLSEKATALVPLLGQDGINSSDIIPLIDEVVSTTVQPGA